jgi:hypothetical protein
VAELWDASIENTVRKLAYGTILGALGGLLMFRAPPSTPPCCTHSPHRVVLRTASSACRAACRTCVSPCSMQAAGRALAQARADALHSPWTGTPVARSAIAGMGAGIGIGMGYTDCKHEFDQMAKDQAGQ